MVPVRMPSHAARWTTGLLPLLLAGACGATPTVPGNTAAPAATKAKLPADVAIFKARRDQCDHFRGEDPGEDEARAAQLERQLARTCTGSDAQLKALRKRYAGNAAAKAALARYDDSIE